MIYVIAGIAKAGKTFLCKKALMHYQKAYFSTDYLMMTLVKAKPELGIVSTADDMQVGKQLEPYLYSMIETMVENNEDYVIEGVHIYPEFAALLREKFTTQIKIIFVGIDQVDIYEKISELKCYQNQLSNPWFMDYNEEEMYDLVSFLVRASQDLKEQAIRHGFPYFSVYHIENEWENILATLFNKKVIQ